MRQRITLPGAIAMRQQADTQPSLIGRRCLVAHPSFDASDLVAEDAHHRKCPAARQPGRRMQSPAPAGLRAR